MKRRQDNPESDEFIDIQLEAYKARNIIREKFSAEATCGVIIHYESVMDGNYSNEEKRLASQAVIDKLKELKKPESDVRALISVVDAELRKAERMVKEDVSSRTFWAFGACLKGFEDLKTEAKKEKVDWSNLLKDLSDLNKKIEMIIKSAEIDKRAAETIRDKTPEDLLQEAGKLLLGAERELAKRPAAKEALVIARSIFNNALGWEKKKWNKIDVCMECRKLGNRLIDARSN